MRQFAKHTMIFLLSLIFLVSFSGIRMLVHHCLSCETTDIAILAFSSENTRSLHQKHMEESSCNLPSPGEEIHTCCDANDHQHEECHDCCKSEEHYLKTDYKISHDKPEVRVVPTELILLTSLVLPAEHTKPLTTSERLFYPDRAPPRPAGRDFVIYSHQLKIA